MSGLQNLPTWAQILIAVAAVAPGAWAFKRAYRERPDTKGEQDG